MMPGRRSLSFSPFGPSAAVSVFFLTQKRNFFSGWRFPTTRPFRVHTKFFSFQMLFLSSFTLIFDLYGEE